MLDMESKVKDILETDYALEEKIEQAVDNTIASMIDRWMRNHDFESWISDAVELAISDDSISDAVESAIDSFVEDAIG